MKHSHAGFRPGTSVVVAAVAIGLLYVPAQAQYFGRNKVQYETFDFRVLDTPHFQIHFYPEAASAVDDAIRMSERWYEQEGLYVHLRFADEDVFELCDLMCGRLEKEAEDRIRLLSGD